MVLFTDSSHTQMGCLGLRGSEITLYGESPIEKDRIHPRNKVKTNGHFTTFMQVGLEFQQIKELILIYAV